jgi:acyl-CoA thioesterase I
MEITLIKRIVVLLILLLKTQPALACPTIDGLVDVNCDGKLTIVCFGDSITYGYGDSTNLGYPGRLSQLLPDAEVYNLGVRGERTFQGVPRAKQEIPNLGAVDYFILLEGINDIWVKGHSASKTKSNLLTIRSLAQKHGAIVLLGSLTKVTNKTQPGWVSQVNKQIKPYVLVDFNSINSKYIGKDHLHPSDAGYQQMAILALKRLLYVSLHLKSK